LKCHNIALRCGLIREHSDRPRSVDHGNYPMDWPWNCEAVDARGLFSTIACGKRGEAGGGQFLFSYMFMYTSVSSASEETFEMTLLGAGETMAWLTTDADDVAVAVSTYLLGLRRM
jgi:hypothetical protein